MQTFNRPGPVNTESVVNDALGNTSLAEAIVVASITGDSALKIARAAGGKQTVCVSCPRGMAWEMDGMNTGVFADIPELRALRDGWRSEGRTRVPMEISPQNRALLNEAGVAVIRGTIPFLTRVFRCGSTSATSPLSISWQRP